MTKTKVSVNMTPRQIMERSRVLQRRNSTSSDHGSEPDIDPEDMVLKLCTDMLVKRTPNKGDQFKSLDGDECVSNHVSLFPAPKKKVNETFLRSTLRGREKVVPFSRIEDLSCLTQTY
jgi:hypothetical protein